MSDENVGSDIEDDGIFCIFMRVSVSIYCYILRSHMALIPVEVFSGDHFTA